MGMAWTDARDFDRAAARQGMESARLNLIIARAAQTDDKNFKRVMEALEK